MSYTSNVLFEQFTENVFDCRTVVEIQRTIIKQSGQNPVTGLLNMNDDKESITTWKLDFNKILHVFNVCRLGPTPLSLTSSFSDSVGNLYSCDGFGPPSKHADCSGKCWW